VLTAGAAPGVLVNSSTVSAEVSAMVRAAVSAVGTTFLAAPVSGNPKVAHSGRLTLAVSGGGDVRLRRLRRAVPGQDQGTPRAAG
jgi:3-hydroxyisobutyrate dehydrogenase